MKVAVINPWAISDNAIGGTERFVEDIANSYKEQDCSVDVYMFSGNNHTKNSVNYISLDLFGKGKIADEYMIVNEFGSFETKETYDKISKRLESLIDCDSYDFLHLNSHFFLTSWQDKKRVITLHSNAEEFKVLWNDKEYNLMIEIMAIQAKNPKTKIVSPSAYYTKEWEILLNCKVYNIPHALNRERLKVSSDISKESLIKKYGLSKDKIKILLPSRLEPIQKQPKLILEGISLLNKEDISKFQVIFTGIDDQYKQFINELDEYAKLYNIDAKFIIFDSINEGYYLTDLVAVPSKSESFGYSALESLSLGIKTILTSIPTYYEISEGNNSAYIFGKNKEELAKVLKTIIEENDYERKNISEDWISKYDITKFGKRYMDVVEND